MVPITDMDQLYDNAVVFLIPATSSLVCSTNTPFPRVTATWNHTSVHELAVWIARLHSITIPTHRSGNTSSLSLAYTRCEDNHCKYHYTTKSRILEDTPPLVAVPHSTDLVDFEEHALLRPAFPTQHTHFRASEELHCCRHARSVAYQTFSAQKPGLQRRVHSSFALHRPWTMHSEGTENGLPSRLIANRLGPESGDSRTCSSNTGDKETIHESKHRDCAWESHADAYKKLQIDNSRSEGTTNSIQRTTGWNDGILSHRLFRRWFLFGAERACFCLWRISLGNPPSEPFIPFPIPYAISFIYAFSSFSFFFLSHSNWAFNSRE